MTFSPNSSVERVQTLNQESSPLSATSSKSQLWEHLNAVFRKTSENRSAQFISKIPQFVVCQDASLS